MRCRICDTSQQGLSLFRPDGHYHSTQFHQLPDGDVLCDECFQEGEEVLDMWNLEQTLSEEEDGAFDYE